VDELVRWLGEQLDEEERIAREASGGTVVGEPGSWQPAPGGDEWEAFRTDCDEDELLVALRPDLPRPPDVMGGLWGAIVDFKPEFEDPRVSSPLPQFVHAARHDPARVLREIDAKRKLLVLHRSVTRTDFTSPTGEPAGPLEVCHECDANTTDPDWPDSPCRTLRYLARPYADRPGYREEWRP
jgi:hypothetical protein